MGSESLFPSFLRPAADTLEAPLRPVRVDLFPSPPHRKTEFTVFGYRGSLRRQGQRNRGRRGLHRAGKETSLFPPMPSSDQSRDAVPHHGQAGRRQTPAQLPTKSDIPWTIRQIKRSQTGQIPAAVRRLRTIAGIWCVNSRQAFSGIAGHPSAGLGPLRSRAATAAIRHRQDLQLPPEPEVSCRIPSKGEPTRNSNSAPGVGRDQDQRHHRWCNVFPGQSLRRAHAACGSGSSRTKASWGKGRPWQSATEATAADARSA